MTVLSLSTLNKGIAFCQTTAYFSTRSSSSGSPSFPFPSFQLSSACRHYGRPWRRTLLFYNLETRRSTCRATTWKSPTLCTRCGCRNLLSRALKVFLCLAGESCNLFSGLPCKNQASIRLPAASSVSGSRPRYPLARQSRPCSTRRGLVRETPFCRRFCMRRRPSSIPIRWSCRPAPSRTCISRSTDSSDPESRKVVPAGRKLRVQVSPAPRMRRMPSCCISWVHYSKKGTVAGAFFHYYSVSNSLSSEGFSRSETRRSRSWMILAALFCAALTVHSQRNAPRRTITDMNISRVFTSPFHGRMSLINTKPPVREGDSAKRNPSKRADWYSRVFGCVPVLYNTYWVLTRL